MRIYQARFNLAVVTAEVARQIADAAGFKVQDYKAAKDLKNKVLELLKDLLRETGFKHVFFGLYFFKLANGTVLSP